MFVTFGNLSVNIFHKSIYGYCSLYHAYYSQISRQRAVLKFKLHLLKLWFHALIVLYKGFTDFTLVLFRFQNDCHLRYSGAEAGATGTLTKAFRDWFLRR